ARRRSDDESPPPRREALIAGAAPDTRPPSHQKSGLSARGTGIDSSPKYENGFSAHTDSISGPALTDDDTGLSGMLISATPGSTRRQRCSALHGIVYAPGSSTLTLTSIPLPLSIMRMRSTTWSCSVCGV